MIQAQNVIGKAHLSKSCAPPLNNVDYCKKNGDFFEIGDITSVKNAQRGFQLQG
jgi:hypothetical protein